MTQLTRNFKKAAFHLRGKLYRKTLAPPLPSHIQIEPTVRCNLRCGSCTRESVIDTYKKLDMTVEDMERILSEFPTLQSIKFQGLGEPLLTANLDALLEKARARHIRMWTISNGTVLSAERNRERLVKFFDDVSISIDSADPDLFRVLRPPAELNSIIENVQALVSDRNAQKSSLSIGITFCAQAENIGEIAPLGDLALKMGVDYVSVGLAENWTVTGDADHDKFAVMARAAFARRNEIASELSRLRRRLLFHGIILGRNNWEMRLGKCHWPFQSLFINVEGEVTPCCVRSQRTHSLGNVFSKPISEIWNSNPYRQLRDDHISKNRDSRLCGTCPL